MTGCLDNQKPCGLCICSKCPVVLTPSGLEIPCEQTGKYACPGLSFLACPGFKVCPGNDVTVKTVCGMVK
jgi:hypothetical protein